MTRSEADKDSIRQCVSQGETNARFDVWMWNRTFARMCKRCDLEDHAQKKIQAQQGVSSRPTPGKHGHARSLGSLIVPSIHPSLWTADGEGSIFSFVCSRQSIALHTVWQASGICFNDLDGGTYRSERERAVHRRVKSTSS